jgi:hypothetical protein
MSLTIEQFYQEIGQAALALAEGLAGKLVIYAEAEDGVIAADLFYVTKDSVVRFRFCPPPMRDLIYRFWEHWKAQPGNREWRAMAYVVDGGKFSIDLTYPDQVDPQEDISDRRPAIVRRYFADMKVDYSKPN